MNLRWSLTNISNVITTSLTGGLQDSRVSQRFARRPQQKAAKRKTCSRLNNTLTTKRSRTSRLQRLLTSDSGPPFPHKPAARHNERGFNRFPVETSIASSRSTSTAYGICRGDNRRSQSRSSDIEEQHVLDPQRRSLCPRGTDL